MNRIDKRFLEWDGAPVAIPTRDKTYIHVDTFARWRIDDPKTYFVRLHDERSAQSRSRRHSRQRNAQRQWQNMTLSKSCARTRTENRCMTRASKPGRLDVGTIGVLPPIAFGRAKIEAEIKAAAAVKLAEFGIELLDVRLKRVNYNPDVLDRIYQRMISERLQIAQRFRSEGEGEAARIAGQRERDLNEIQSTPIVRCRRSVGRPMPKPREIYARAYTQNPQAAEFYGFLKSMETYRKVLTKESTLVLSTDSDLLRYLRHSGGAIPVAPRPSSAFALASRNSGCACGGHLGPPRKGIFQEICIADVL